MSNKQTSAAVKQIAICMIMYNSIVVGTANKLYTHTAFDFDKEYTIKYS